MTAFCTCPPSGNQVDGLPLALHKDAASASWPWFGRACERKIRRVFLSSEEVCDINEIANLSNVASLYIKALTGASESLK